MLDLSLETFKFGVDCCLKYEHFNLVVVCWINNVGRYREELISQYKDRTVKVILSGAIFDNNSTIIFVSPSETFRGYRPNLILIDPKVDTQLKMETYLPRERMYEMKHKYRPLKDVLLIFEDCDVVIRGNYPNFLSNPEDPSIGLSDEEIKYGILLGIARWTDGKLISLDGDSYSVDMEIYNYEYSKTSNTLTVWKDNTWSSDLEEF